MIYKTESFESSDKDYDYMIRSLNDKGCAKIPKVLHMFRIIPADQTDVENSYNNYLYLHGVTANKVMNILKKTIPNVWDRYLVNMKNIVLQMKCFFPKHALVFLPVCWIWNLKKAQVIVELALK